MINDDVEKLRQQVQELAGRVTADAALLRLVVTTVSTPQLRTTQSLVEKLAEDNIVRNQMRVQPAIHKGFEDQRKQWLQLIAQEIASRDAAAPQV